ncbi:lysylphosphatidylglycerol synthase transmembrane domain-containing protein [Salinarimonas rosea]|uniref:lysylphosphatidylglycerol synthase transmembrane domain-containing protein n=1 Tax=Salinarimonas rosea TaxID=552063 RepID=UPI00042626C2|nr:lysylphosphatidylglycerol synthase transmembrane domain-containing protein [Salinarimonas rosea]
MADHSPTHLPNDPAPVRGAPAGGSLGGRVAGLLRDERLRVGLRALALVALMALLFGLVDGRETLAALGRAAPGPLLLGLVLVQAQIALSGVRWRITAKRLGVPITLGTAVREYYVASFLNQVLPGGVAGDAIRAVRNRDRDADGSPRWRPVVRSIVLERAAGQVVFFAVAASGLALAPVALARAAPDGTGHLIAIPFAVATAIALAVVAASRIGPKALREALADLGPDIARVFWKRGVWLPQIALSLSIVASYVAVFALAGAALGIVLPALAWIALAPLVLAAMLIPVSIGGWGVREGAAAALLPLAGVDASHALAVAILYGLTSLAGSLPGLVLLGLRRRR